MTDPSPPPPTEAPEPAVAKPRGSMVGDIDRLLRGHYTSEAALHQGRLEIPLRTLGIGSLLLGAFYGASMGLFSGLNSSAGNGSWMQVVASAVKVPVLFLLTLLVTFPSLYVVSALSRSRLQTADTMRVLLGAITINLALLASLGPVAAFFTLSTDSYPFMKLLHVLFFTVSGVAGLGFLLRALRTILEPAGATEAASFEPGPADPAAPAVPGYTAPPQHRWSQDSAALQVRRVFRLWILIFGLVGAQMGWILRPFIGSPTQEFTWFRERGSNILQDVFRTIGDLF